MALQKDIKMDNELTLSYHRINTILIHTNNQIIIELTSYLNEEERLKEKEMLEQVNNSNMQENISINIYIHTKYYNIDYNEEFSVVRAYEYLKTLDEFLGSKDV